MWMGSSLPACPHLSPLRIGGKGAFCPACEGWGCLYPSMHPQAGTCPTDPGQHPLTREAQTRQVAVDVLQDQQVLVALDQFGHGNHLVINWKARGERGPLLASVTPCWGSAWAELAALVGAAHPLYPGRLIPVGTSLVPQRCHTHCMGWKKFFPPTSRHVFRCKRARGSGCQIPGGRSGRVQGAAVVLPPPRNPGPALQPGLYRAPRWSCAERPGCCWCSSQRMSHSCGAERSDGVNTSPQTAPTKPEGFRTRARLLSLNKFGIAALQPQICGSISAQRMAPVGGNAPGDGGAG